MRPTKLLGTALIILCSTATASADEHPWTPDQTAHWAWKTPERPPVLATADSAGVREPIDAYIRSRLERAGLRPASAASREHLLRRATFDLIGLPPDPADVAAFTADPSPDAYEKRLDRLLASPAHGERWGRHWLDLARYADTNGFEHDEVRPDAWKYRDYVIDSLNADKPYDVFVREQLAGDELYPDDPAARVATMFHMLGPDMTDAATPEQRRQNKLNDVTDATGLVFLGLTIGCARCHDHKFEPIPQADYYRLQAFFTPVSFRKDLTVADKPAPPPATFVLRRGELGQPGPRVEPGWPVAMSPGFRETPAGVEPPAPDTSGRRSTLARWLTDRDNPTAARVVVNRLWKHHFGRGIVASTSDFGVRGERPTHPELLDWLAVELPHRGWSLKSIHRLMMLSETYQRSVMPGEELLAADPGNALLGRMSRRRLEGEAVRDALLAAAGALNRTMGGPGVFPPLPVEMKANGKGGWAVDPDPASHARRAVYIFARRNLRYPFLEVFDYPDSNLSCPERENSTTAPQALAMLNSADVAAAVAALTARLERRADSTDGRIVLAFRLALGRTPDAEEVSLAREFLRESPLSEFCRALLNVSEFLYVD